MEANNIWKIEKAGLHCFGHINRVCVDVEITRKSLHWAFPLRVDQVTELFDVLDIDYEDGVYVHEALKGKFITVIGDGEMYMASKVVRVGDPYGEEFIDIRYGE